MNFLYGYRKLKDIIFYFSQFFKGGGINLFNILVVIFMFSIIMLLFFLINIIAKFINNRSIGKSVVMINLFFIITNTSFIFGGVFFAKQNNMTVFNDINNNIKPIEPIETTKDITAEVIKDTEHVTEQITQPTPDKIVIDWDLVISDTLHDATNKLSYEYLNITLDNNEFNIDLIAPAEQTEDTILFNITTILDLINFNAKLQDESSNAFNDYNIILNVFYSNSTHKILDEYIILAGNYNIKDIPLNIPTDISKDVEQNLNQEPDQEPDQEPISNEITIEYGE